METLWARRRPILAVALALVVALLVVSALRGTPTPAPQTTSGPLPTPTSSVVYHFVLEGPPRGATAHVGDALLFSLVPQPIPTPQATLASGPTAGPTATPTALTCSLTFFGPYETTAVALVSLPTLPDGDASGKVPQPAFATTPPIADWLGAPFQVAVPPTLVTGFYVWVGRCTDQHGNTDVKDVVQVLP
jgi:hypothetical protein